MKMMKQDLCTSSWNKFIALKKQDIFLQMMSKTLAIRILKGKKWVLFHTNIYPTKPGESSCQVEKWVYHIIFPNFLWWKSSNTENGNLFSFLLPSTPAAFFSEDFPDTFMGIPLGLVGKIMQTSIRTLL